MNVPNKLGRDKPVKVLMGVPHMGKIETETSISIQNLIKPCVLEGAYMNSTDISTARNQICQDAVEQGFDYVFFVDSDMVFPNDTLAKLLKLQVDIATPICYSRHKPYNPCIFKAIEPSTDVERSGIAETDTRINEVAPFITGGCGMALTLISTKAIKWLYGQNTRPFDKLMGLGEDVSFCYKVKDKFPIWVEPTIEVLHIGRKAFGKEDYLYEQSKVQRVTFE